MEFDKLFESSVINGLLFSAYDKFGPQPIYRFPKEVSEEKAEDSKKYTHQLLTYRDYMQISIKNLSMFVGDKEFTELTDDIEELPNYAILPYPDYNLTSLTFFHSMKMKTFDKIIPSSFSILVNRNRRSFLYNNLNKFKSIIFEFFLNFDKEVSNGYKSAEEIKPIFRRLLLKLIEVENKPFASITSKRKMKIIFAGLDDSGKTSFLISIDKKYSKLIGLKPTVGASVSSVQALGTSIFLWDLGGQFSLREKYLSKSQIYLYDTDLLFYFIDIRNKTRFDESIEYFKKIKNALEEFHQDTPIIFIFSKGDGDILNTKKIKDNINLIKSKLVKILSNENPEIYVTSIFSIFSILRGFSAGISKLSPNRDLINLNLKNFSERVGISLSLLLNNEGLVLADFYSQEALNLIGFVLPNDLTNQNLRSIFEITAPQFAILYKIFSKFRNIKEQEAIYKIAESVIIFRKIQISDFNMFLLFLTDDEKIKEKISELIPDLLFRTSDLLLRYIS
ncbi:MAG: ADP-ribosylation factor-like protein [Candidatus Hermodarchaeota archaeon]